MRVRYNKSFEIYFVEDLTDDLASECIEKGLLDELLALCGDDTLITKVAQVLAEVAKTGILNV